MRTRAFELRSLSSPAHTAGLSVPHMPWPCGRAWEMRRVLACLNTSIIAPCAMQAFACGVGSHAPTAPYAPIALRSGRPIVPLRTPPTSPRSPVTLPPTWPPAWPRAFDLHAPSVVSPWATANRMTLTSTVGWRSRSIAAPG